MVQHHEQIKPVNILYSIQDLIQIWTAKLDLILWADYVHVNIIVLDCAAGVDDISNTSVHHRLTWLSISGHLMSVVRPIHTKCRIMSTNTSVFRENLAKLQCSIVCHQKMTVVYWSQHMFNLCYIIILKVASSDNDRTACRSWCSWYRHFDKPQQHKPTVTAGHILLMVLWNQASRPISNGFRDIQRRIWRDGWHDKGHGDSFW